MVILECPTKVPGRLQVVLDWLQTPKPAKHDFRQKFLRKIAQPDRESRTIFKNHIFPNLYENHSWRSPAHSEGPQTPKTCFWAWIRSLKPQKHPWMARWHSNSWIVSLNISRMQTGQNFRDIQLGFPERPQVVFNRFTDSHPNPASRPQAPPDLVNHMFLLTGGLYCSSPGNYLWHHTFSGFDPHIYNSVYSAQTSEKRELKLLAQSLWADALWNSQ